MMTTESTCAREDARAGSAAIAAEPRKKRRVIRLPTDLTLQIDSPLCAAVPQRGHLPKGAAAGSSVRRREEGGVGGVHRLGAELQLQFFAHAKILDRRNVPVV